jgi:hypothetical protein
MTKRRIELISCYNSDKHISIVGKIITFVDGVWVSLLLFHSSFAFSVRLWLTNVLYGIKDSFHIQKASFFSAVVN